MKAYCEMDSEMLEQFSMGKASVEETQDFEEHLLFCNVCRKRFEESKSYVAEIRSAAAQLRRERADQRPSWTMMRLVPALAGMALLTAAIVAVARSPATPPMAMAVFATRSSVPGGTARGGRATELSVDLSGISGAEGAFRLQLVDDRGRVTWQGPYLPAAGPVTVPAQAGGAHFVRVYSPGGQLLREYGLMVER